MKKLEWKDEDLYIGKILIGSVFYDGFTSVKENNMDKYKINCKLPQTKTMGKRFLTGDDARKELEITVESWFKYIME